MGAKIQRNSLRREITVVLLVKLALLFAIWFAFFSHPLDRSLTGHDVSRVLVGSGADSPAPNADVRPSHVDNNKESGHGN
jgi:hypothetical protein